MDHRFNLESSAFQPDRAILTDALSNGTPRLWVSAVSGLEFGTQRLRRWHFKFCVFAVTDGSVKHWTTYGDFEAATPEAQRRQ